MRDVGRSRIPSSAQRAQGLCLIIFTFCQNADKLFMQIIEYINVVLLDAMVEGPPRPYQVVLRGDEVLAHHLGPLCKPFDILSIPVPTIISFLSHSSLSFPFEYHFCFKF